MLCWKRFKTKNTTIWFLVNISHPFYIRFSFKIPRNIKNGARGSQKWTKLTAKWAKVIPKAPKVNPRARKVGQKWAKSEPKGTQSEPKGAKREPKVSPIQHKSQGREKDEKKGLPAWPVRTFAGPFREPFSIKNRWKNRCENWCRKSDEILWKIYAKMDLYFLYFSRKMFM